MNLQQIKQIDITILINKYLSLERTGNYYKSLCPFHKEKTPSFIVFPRTNTFKCFGCNKSGSNIDFIMLKEGLQFTDACKYITREFNVEQVVEIKDTPKIILPKIVQNETIKYWHDYLLDSGRIEYFINRGLNTITIIREMLGWTGEKYTIPIWKDKPQYSPVVGTRFRKSEITNPKSPKYVGIKGNNLAGFWGKWYTKFKDYMFLFFGELDATLAVQDGLPATSLINGMSSFKSLPRNWPILEFPNVKNLLVIPDVGEEIEASKLVNHWNTIKGGRFGDVLQWGLKTENNSKDYTEFRALYDLKTILNMFQKQTGVSILC